MKLSWTDFKAVIIDKNLYIQYVATPTVYYLLAYDGPFEFNCNLDRNPSDTTDLLDFENNYKNLSTTNLPLTQLDLDGAQVVRNKAAQKGWTFCSLPFEFETSRLSDTLYSKTSDGTSRSFITLKAYDASDTEVTTAGLLDVNYSTIVKTVIDFEPPWDYEVIGGDIRTLTSIDTDIRLWIVAVPDIPAGSGGSKEMGGGINLRYMAPGNVFSVDGRVSKYATYSATYHTNKLRLIFKYPAGTHESLMVVAQVYKA